MTTLADRRPVRCDHRAPECRHVPALPLMVGLLRDPRGPEGLLDALGSSPPRCWACSTRYCMIVAGRAGARSDAPVEHIDIG